ncbi:MAG: Selenocysteine-specific elongation factor [Syntrophomonadaceae bacterium]|nr:Selenocysteine-specific elongation factor [Bacillota bacterium]
MSAYVIVGTAGHVDHGKTALIRALTGVDTDRLREEQERGISIELGFAPFRLPSGRLAGVIDVPGHEKFIHNMLAGIGGIDLVLLLVDVMEGVMPQTREHVEIMQLLRIPRGVVVLAKIDLAEDPDWLDLVEEEVRESLSGTFLESAPYVRVSALTGEGLAELRKVIDTLTGEVPERDKNAPLRLPVDRVFSMTGFGTVVTGTLLAGRIIVGENVQILPLGRQARIRQLQVYGEEVTEAVAGMRVAVNLSGVEREALERGSVLARPGFLTSVTLLDARLFLLAGAGKAMKNMTRVHVYLGTGRTVGRVVLVDCEELAPGGAALVQLRLEKPLVAYRGDRFIIRSYSPMTTIGGGVVLQAGIRRLKRFKEEVLADLEALEKGDPAAPLLQRLRREAVVSLKTLEKEAGLPLEQLRQLLERLERERLLERVGELLADGTATQEWREKIMAVLTFFHNTNRLSAGMSRAELKASLPKNVPQKVYDYLLTDLEKALKITVCEDLVAAFGHRPEPDAKETEQLVRIERLYREKGFTPPTFREMTEQTGLKAGHAESLVNYLALQGRLVRLDDELALHHDFFVRARELLCDHFQKNRTLSAADFRTKLGTSRKFVLPLLEKFDHLKMTRRQGLERVPWRLGPDFCAEVQRNDGE